MQNDNYITIFGWMTNELGLSGNELNIFALIYGFSQDGESWFQGNRRYIAETLNITRPTVDRALISLQEKGLIIKQAYTNNDITTNRYKVSLQGVKNLYRGCKESLQGVSNFFTGGCKESLHKNNNKEILNDTDNKKTKKSGKKIAVTREVYFPNDELLDKAFKDYVAMRAEIKKPFTTDEAIDKSIKKLERLSGGNNDIAIQILDESVMYSWQGLFPLKEKKEAKSQNVFERWMNA